MDQAAEDEALEIAKSLAGAMEELMRRPAPRKSRANPLPPIQEVAACPHCGNDDEFYVVQTYSGKGTYRRLFNGQITDNSHMHDCLNAKVGKRAFCSVCDKPVAQWDEHLDSPHYGK